MSERNIFKFKTNELFRDSPYTLRNSNIISSPKWVVISSSTTKLTVGSNGGVDIVMTTGHSASVVGVTQNVGLKGRTGDKYFVKAKYLVNGQDPEKNCTQDVELRISGMDLIPDFVIPTDFGVTKHVSGIFEVPPADNGIDLVARFAITHAFCESPPQPKRQTLEYFGAVNLTDYWGKGKIPTEEECEVIYADLETQSSGVSVKSIIKDNILQDYKGGLITAKHNKLACLDVYDTSGNLVYDFSKGEMLQVGDVVRIDKDNEGNSLMTTPDGSPRYFQVVGRTFSHAGVPLLSPVYREVKL